MSIPNQSVITRVIENDHIIENIFQHSKILTRLQLQSDKFKQVLPFGVRNGVKLYTLSLDGSGSRVFHKKCDGKGPYFLLARVNSYFVFGYFFGVNLSSQEERYETCGNAYIFSLLKNEKMSPEIFEVRQEKRYLSLFQTARSPSLGSTIIGKQDLYIKYLSYGYCHLFLKFLRG